MLLPARRCFFTPKKSADTARELVEQGLVVIGVREGSALDQGVDAAHLFAFVGISRQAPQVADRHGHPDTGIMEVAQVFWRTRKFDLGVI